MAAAQVNKCFVGRRPDVARWVPSFVPKHSDLRRVVSVASWDHDSSEAFLQFFSLSPVAPYDDYEDYYDHGDERNFETDRGIGSFRRSSFDSIGEWTHQGKITEMQVLPSDYDHSSTFLCSSSEGHFSLYKHHFAYADEIIRTSFDSKQRSTLRNVHEGKITAFDTLSSSTSCITVGEDGTFCLIDIESLKVKSKTDYKHFIDLKYSAIQFVSVHEFVTASLNGFHWWDLRQSKRPHSQTSLAWSPENPGAIHSIAVHPFQKNLLLAGGSRGRVLCFDRRRTTRKQNLFPIIELSGNYANSEGYYQSLEEDGPATVQPSSNPPKTFPSNFPTVSPLKDLATPTKSYLQLNSSYRPTSPGRQEHLSFGATGFGSEIAVSGFRKSSESMADGEVWKVQFDFDSTWSVANSGANIPPFCFCTEDGIVAYVSDDRRYPVIRETSCINTFDISVENNGEMICGLENESLLHLSFR